MEVRFDSFRISNLPPYHLGTVQQEVLNLRAQGHEVIDLSHLNPNTGPAPRAVDRLVQAVLQPHNHRYSSSRGITQLRQAAIEWFRDRYNLTFDVEHEVVVTMGSKEGISHLLLALLNPGDSVIVPTPSYPIHASAVFLAGGNFIGVPLFAGEDGDQAQDEPLVLTEKSDPFFARLEAICQHTWPRPRMFLCSFPHNPTTTVVTQGFFDRLSELAEREELLIVHDAAYVELVYDGYQAPSILTAGGRAVEFFSLSKAHGLAGWRVGFALGNREMLGALRKIKSYLDSGSFQPLQIAAIEALRDSDKNVESVRELYNDRRLALLEGLHEIGWEVAKPQGTIFVWARLPKAVRKMGSVAFSRSLLSENSPRVAIAPGAFFDPQADEYVRFALSEGESRLRRATQSIGRILNQETR